MFSKSLLIVLLGLSCLLIFTMAQSANGAAECCFGFQKKPLPTDNVVSFEETRSECTQAGIIFNTKKGFRICVDPEVGWVKEIIKTKPKVQKTN